MVHTTNANSLSSSPIYIDVYIDMINGSEPGEKKKELKTELIPEKKSKESNVRVPTEPLELPTVQFTRNCHRPLR